MKKKLLFRRRLQVEPLERRRLLATVTVNTLVDELDGSIVDGDVSLRDALAMSSNGDRIEFDAALDGGEMLLTLGELFIRHSLDVDARSLTNGLTVDASGNDPSPHWDEGDGTRVFTIDDGTPRLLPTRSGRCGKACDSVFGRFGNGRLDWCDRL